MNVIILYFPHRVEFLEMFENSTKNCDILILEEPETPELKKLLSEEMSPEEYIKWVDTTFPVYTKHYAKLLVRLHSKGVKILPVEPYLQVIEGIHKAVEEECYEDYIKKDVVKAVIEVEKRATQALLEYQETFMKKDFDEIVKTVINFSKADAVRFRMRDYMRAREIENIIKNLELKINLKTNKITVIVEAGQIHTHLIECLKKFGINALSDNLVKKVTRELGISYEKNPGMYLTELHIKSTKIDKNYEKLLAAQALVYITIVKKQEMIPKYNQKFPHLINEINCTKFAKSLNYQQCKKFFEKMWRYKK